MDSNELMSCEKDKDKSTNDPPALYPEAGIELKDEKGQDEDDGRVSKAILKIVGGIKNKRKNDKEDIEPFTENPSSWTYSQYETKTSDAEEFDNRGSNQQSGSLCKLVEQVNITENDIYDFKHPQRGYLLLIINETFYRQAWRRGAHLDLENMQRVASKLGLRFLNDKQMNLSQSETLSWLQKAQTMDHTDCDCFMFMISTHGLEQKNPMKGSQLDHALVCADDRLIFTSTIMEMFSDANCPTLKGKPKIFIIQACRGTDVDHGSDVKVIPNKNKYHGRSRDKSAKSDNVSWAPEIDHTDAKGREDSFVDDSVSDTEAPSLQCDADMLIVYAVPPGMLAWRNSSDGSWMIHYLHEVLAEYDMKSPKNFLHVLTKVAAKMSRRTTDVPDFQEMHEKKAVPVIEHKLTKDIMFS